jgi:hypothetical protein
MEKELKVISVKHRIEKLRKESDEVSGEWEKFWHSLRIEGGCTREGYAHDKETDEYKPAVGANAQEKADLRILRALATRVKKIDARIEELQQELADENFN